MDTELISVASLTIDNATKELGFDDNTYFSILNATEEIVSNLSQELKPITTDEQYKRCKKERTAINKVYKSVESFRKTESKKLIEKMTTQCKSISDILWEVVDAHDKCLAEYDEKKATIEKEVKERLNMTPEVITQEENETISQTQMYKIEGTSLDLTVLDEIKAFAKSKGVDLTITTL